MFARGAGLCIGLGCWGLKIPHHCPDVLCDLLVLTEEDGVHVLTIALQNKPRVRIHSQTVATVLKNKLVIHGGLRCKFGIVSHVIDVTQFQVIAEAESNLFNRDLYPSHFSNSGKFDGLIDSLIICMSSYTAHPLKSWACNVQGSYKFLLTHDQFDLLWTQQFTKELWVHGPPGAGKTEAAIQLIQELRRRGCNFNNILYLAENEKLCDFVRYVTGCFWLAFRGDDCSACEQHIADRFAHPFSLIKAIICFFDCIKALTCDMQWLVKLQTPIM